MIKIFVPDGSQRLRCKNCLQSFWVHPVKQAYGPGTEPVAVCPEKQKEEPQAPLTNFNVVTEMFNQVAHRAYHHDDEVAQAMVMVMKQMADAFGHEWLYDDVMQKWSLVQKG